MEPEGGGVDAVPQARRFGAILEHMPQVGTALGTLHLGPPHEQAAVLLFPHGLLLDRRPETRPTRSGIVLCPRREERLPTDHRSEERRVGKEWRARRATERGKKHMTSI